MSDRIRGAIEGYYGAPLERTDRLDLVRWLGTQGATDYVYAPKDDPWQRASWREPYPAEHLAGFAELVEVGREAGVRIGAVISPGLDWQRGDEDVLVAKLRAFYDVGIRSLGVAFDDVPPGGAELGGAHGDAVAAAVAGLPDDVRWATCPTDYAFSHVTAYLAAFADAVPAGVDLFWTGPAIVSPTIDAAEATALAEELGHRLVLADNVPVNDGPMSGVLHLGPYPARDPGLVDATGGVLLALMPGYPRASRIGIACGLRWWADPTQDRESTWREVVGEVPGLAPLASASRSWLTEPGPDVELLDWAETSLQGDTRLLDFLAAGPRAGLPDDWAGELAAWLAAWEWEAFAMALVIYAARAPRPMHGEVAFTTAEVTRRLRILEQQLFGIRQALYPVTRREDDVLVPDRAGLVRGENLTDMLCRRVLDHTFGDAP